MERTTRVLTILAAALIVGGGAMCGGAASSDSVLYDNYSDYGFFLLICGCIIGAVSVYFAFKADKSEKNAGKDDNQ